jgi:hypothetical protein
MSKCEVCGNDYEHIFEVRIFGESHWFDCFECACYALAPACAHCGVRILGHGVEGDRDQIYCGAHCARAHGYKSISDNVNLSQEAAAQSRIM